MELLWYDQQSENEEHGYLIFTDVIYKPLLKSYSAGIRGQYFETDSYNSRLYAFENDVLYSYSIPAFYNKGLHWYLNSRLAFKKRRYRVKNINITSWLKIAQTIEFRTTVQGPGMVATKSNCRTEVKVQFFLGWGRNNN